MRQAISAGLAAGELGAKIGAGYVNVQETLKKPEEEAATRGRVVLVDPRHGRARCQRLTLQYGKLRSHFAFQFLLTPLQRGLSADQLLGLQRAQMKSQDRTMVDLDALVTRLKTTSSMIHEEVGRCTLTLA
jgi:hypothetical protein